MVYRIRYKAIPSNLSSHPSIENESAFFIIFAPRLTSNTTTIKTTIKLKNGSHLEKLPDVFSNECATTAESFIAAASPIIKLKREKRPTTKPFLIPLKRATIKIIKKKASMLMQTG